MRAYVPAYEMVVPRDLSDALELLTEKENPWRPLAGGTDLMVAFESGKLDHCRYISIAGLRELRRIEVAEDSVTVGALCTYSDVLRHPVLRAEFSLLAAAASETGGVAIQSRGTLGGNIVNASPAADTPPALLVYDAEVELTSARGSRWLAYRDFHTGYKKTRMAWSELLTRIRLRRLPGGIAAWPACFRKVGTRRAQAISKVCFAGLRNRQSGETRIAFGSVAPVPLRCFSTEAAIREGRDPAEALAAELSPIDDLRSTKEYRGRVAVNLLLQFLEAA